MARIVGLGGSSMYGQFGPGGGTMEIVKGVMQALSDEGRYPAPTVHVDAEPGRSLRVILAKMTRELVLPGKEVRVFWVGASDARIPADEEGLPAPEGPVVPLGEFDELLAGLGGLCKERGILPIYLGWYRFNDNFTQPHKSANGYYTNERLQTYSGRVEKHAARTGAPFVPLWDALDGNTSGYERHLCPDHLHLGSGHVNVAALLMPTIFEVLEVSRSRVDVGS